MEDYRRVVIMRIDNLMYGVIGAYLSYYYKDFWIKSSRILFITGIILLILWKVLSYQYPQIETFFYVNIFYPLFCLGILCILPVLSQFQLKKYGFISSAVTYISLISYSLYLIHYSLIKKLLIDHLLFTSIDKNSIFNIILKNIFYWSASIVGSILIYKYFEIPTMKLRDKIRYK
jgi:peptidoglycan/LPS O-acetylase OafA/YrhL